MEFNLTEYKLRYTDQHIYDLKRIFKSSDKLNAYKTIIDSNDYKTQKDKEVVLDFMYTVFSLELLHGGDAGMIYALFTDISNLSGISRMKFMTNGIELSLVRQ